MGGGGAFPPGEGGLGCAIHERGRFLRRKVTHRKALKIRLDVLGTRMKERIRVRGNILFSPLAADFHALHLRTQSSDGVEKARVGEGGGGRERERG